MKDQHQLQVALSLGRKAGSGRVRVYTWLDYLDVDAEVHCFSDANSYSPREALFSQARQLRGGGAKAIRPDTRLLLCRRYSPFSNGRVEESMLRRASVGIFDFDDAIYLERASAGLYLSPDRWWDQRERTERSARAADVVVAGSETLADWAVDYNDSVVLIPSCVEVERYETKVNYEVGDPPNLVWIGSRSTEAALVDIGGALLKLHTETGARLTLIGEPDGSLGDLDVMVDRMQWSEQAQHDLLAGFDVGLMPLADTPSNRGKCGYKLLQYGAAGLPAVASPVGVNTKICDDAGLAAPETTDEWYDALLELVSTDAATRQGVGQSFNAHVRDHYSYRAWAPVWAEVVLGHDQAS